MSYLEVYECDFCGGRVERKVSWSQVTDRQGTPDGWDNVRGRWICPKCCQDRLGLGRPDERGGDS